MKKFLTIVLISSIVLIDGCKAQPKTSVIPADTTTVESTATNTPTPEPEEIDTPASEPMATDTLTPEHTVTNTPTSTPAKFVPSQDLVVVAAYVYSGDTYVVVQNVGDKPILEYFVAYINFDNNGFVATTDSNGYERGRYSAANLMPNQKSQGSWYGAKGNYAVATVTKIKYRDETEWEASNIDLWVSEQKAQFTPEKYNENIASLENSAKLAESNEFAVLNSIKLTQRNQFSSKKDLVFKIKNTSNQGILKIRLYILEYDKNGFPTAVSPYDTYCQNGHSTGGTINLAKGETEEYSDNLFAQGDTTQIKGIIYNIEFQDGTTWDNPYLYEWMIYNNKNYKD